MIFYCCCLIEMGAECETWPVPPRPVSRSQAMGNVGSELSTRKSKGKAVVEDVGTSTEALLKKSLKPSSTKASIAKAEAQKRKVVSQSEASIGAVAKDLGTDSLMKVSRDTNGGGNWVSEGRLWLTPHDLVDEYCTMCACSGFLVEMTKALVGLH